MPQLWFADEKGRIQIMFSGIYGSDRATKPESTLDQN
jgi:hypothetical protein